MCFLIQEKDRTTCRSLTDIGACNRLVAKVGQQLANVIVVREPARKVNARNLVTGNSKAIDVPLNKEKYAFNNRREFCFSGKCCRMIFIMKKTGFKLAAPDRRANASNGIDEKTVQGLYTELE